VDALLKREEGIWLGLPNAQNGRLKRDIPG
jgi:hypothetical protein